MTTNMVTFVHNNSSLLNLQRHTYGLLKSINFKRDTQGDPVNNFKNETAPCKGKLPTTQKKRELMQVHKSKSLETPNNKLF